MTLSELRTQVGNKLQDKSFTHYGGNNTEVNWAINQGIKIVSTLVPFDLLGTLQGIETATTTDGTAQYDLPSDFFWFKALTIDGRPAQKIFIEEIAVTITNPFAEPTDLSPYCYLNEGKITYLPTPSATTVRILYYAEEATSLSSDTDPNPLSGVLNHAVILYATSILASKDEDADRWLKKYGIEMQKWVKNE